MGHQSIARTRPNVLLVMADEWRAQAFGYAGDANACTPVIDAFAAQSLNFSHAVSGFSVCCPARASLLTGQYPLTHGVYINDVPLEPTGITLAEAYRAAGYSTAYIGKWHLYGSPDGRYGRREAYIPPDKRCGFDYWKVAECSHDYNHSHYYEGNDPVKKYWRGYDAAAQTEDACRYIKDRVRAGDPYLLLLSWGPPHYPLDSAPAECRAQYQNVDITLRPNVPVHLRSTASRELRGYYAHIAALDRCFRRLLDTLEASDSVTDTIVLFMSDHGDMMRSQGLLHKLYPWEESIRIPLLIRYPARFGLRGRSDGAAMSITDVMPTLLGLSGLTPPEGSQGFDHLRSQTTRDRHPARTSAFLNMPVSQTTALMHGFAEYRGVRSGRYTYVRTIRGPWLLYDNVKDPYQMRNLCDQEPWKSIQAKLEEELKRWLELLGDEFLPGAEYVRRDRLQHHLDIQWPVGQTHSPWGDWESMLSKPATFSRDSILKDVLANATARAQVSEVIPQLESLGEPDWLEHFSLRLLQGMGILDISDHQLDRVDVRLSRIHR